MLNNWGEIKGPEMAEPSFSRMDPAGRKPTEENKFFMSWKAVRLPEGRERKAAKGGRTWTRVYNIFM